MLSEAINLYGFRMFKVVFLLFVFLLSSEAVPKGVDCEKILAKCKQFKAFSDGESRCFEGAPPPIRSVCRKRITELKVCLRNCMAKMLREAQCRSVCFGPKLNSLEPSRGAREPRDRIRLDSRRNASVDSEEALIQTNKEAATAPRMGQEIVDGTRGNRQDAESKAAKSKVENIRQPKGLDGTRGLEKLDPQKNVRQGMLDVSDPDGDGASEVTQEKSSPATIGRINSQMAGSRLKLRREKGAKKKRSGQTCAHSARGQSCRKDENGRLSCKRMPRCKDE